MSKLLAVEDDVTQRYVLKIVLENFGFDFEIVPSAEEALADLFERENSYSLVLMDIKLPGMDGFDCTRQIRKLQAAAGVAKIPIIAVTAFASAEDRQLCLDAGMDDYVSKPYTLEAFKSTIDKYLEPARSYNEPSENDTVHVEGSAQL